MNKSLESLIYGILIFIIQILVDDFLNVGQFVYLCLIPALILLIPINNTPIRDMIIAFGIGILFDVMSGNVLGLNAAPAVALAASKDWLFEKIANQETADTLHISDLISISFPRFIRFIAICLFQYLLIYTLLDTVGSGLFVVLIIKLTASFAANVALTVLIMWLLFGHR